MLFSNVSHTLYAPSGENVVLYLKVNLYCIPYDSCKYMLRKMLVGISSVKIFINLLKHLHSFGSPLKPTHTLLHIPIPTLPHKQWDTHTHTHTYQKHSHLCIHPQRQIARYQRADSLHIANSRNVGNCLQLPSMSTHTSNMLHSLSIRSLEADRQRTKKELLKEHRIVMIGIYLYEFVKIMFGY